MIEFKSKTVLNAPNINDEDLIDLLNDLRAKGHIVRTDLKGNLDVNFNNVNGKWKLRHTLTNDGCDDNSYPKNR